MPTSSWSRMVECPCIHILAANDGTFTPNDLICYCSLMLASTWCLPMHFQTHDCKIDPLSPVAFCLTFDWMGCKFGVVLRAQDDPLDLSQQLGLADVNHLHFGKVVRFSPPKVHHPLILYIVFPIVSVVPLLTFDPTMHLTTLIYILPYNITTDYICRRMRGWFETAFPCNVEGISRPYLKIELSYLIYCKEEVLFFVSIFSLSVLALGFLKMQIYSLFSEFFWRYHSRLVTYPELYHYCKPGIALWHSP